jgi:hypothetical protein
MVNGLRSSPRRVWWTSFVLVTLLIGLWSIADPLFAGPDEPAHVVRAVAVSHGQLTGRHPTQPLDDKQLRTVKGATLNVRVPAIFGSVVVPCYAHHGDLLPPCLKFRGSTEDTEVPTYTARNPPAYYSVVGIVSWVHRAGAATVYLMRLITAVIAGALIATAITALRRFAAPGLVAVGLVVAITPVVLFIAGTVNPNATEIAAAIALWVCGLALVTTATERVDRRLVAATGIAAGVLTLSRQVGPLWLGLITLIIAGVAEREALRNLARSSSARVWAVVVAGATTFQLIWDGTVQPLEVTRVHNRGVHGSLVDAVEYSAGGVFVSLREMVDTFGWRDTRAPILTLVFWAVVTGLLVLVAVAWVRRRQVVVLGTLVVATVVVPIVMQATFYRHAGTIWQGRYTLPLAVGIPILAAACLATTPRGRQLVTPRLLWTVGIVIGAGHVLAFTSNLRRYTAGYSRELQYWLAPQWHPLGLPPILLTIAYVAVVVAFIAWVLGAAPAEAARDGSENAATRARAPAGGRVASAAVKAGAFPTAGAGARACEGDEEDC